jgi:hypothetical protein
MYPPLRRYFHSSHYSLAKKRTSTRQVGSDDTISLNCWVIGRAPPSKHFFPLQIGKRMTVAALREAIKLQGNIQLTGKDAKSLDIWKVSVALEDIDAKLGTVRLGNDLGVGGKKLAPRQLLSRIFSDPPAVASLHIIADSPGGEPQWLLPSLPFANLLQLLSKSLLTISYTQTIRVDLNF